MANETTSTTLAVLVKNKMKVKGTYRVPKNLKRKNEKTYLGNKTSS